MEKIYIRLYFACGHSRPTRHRFDAEELQHPEMWIKTSAFCDRCKDLQTIVSIKAF